MSDPKQPEPKEVDSKKSARKQPSAMSDPKPVPAVAEIKPEPLPSTSQPPAPVNSEPKALDSNKSERRIDSVMTSLRKLGSMIRSVSKMATAKPEPVKPAPEAVDSKKGIVSSKKSRRRKMESIKPAAADVPSAVSRASAASSVKKEVSATKKVDSAMLPTSSKSSVKKSSKNSAKRRRFGKKLDATSLALMKIKQKNLKGIDNLIVRLLCIGIPTRGLTKTVPEEDIIYVCERVRKIFSTQPALIEIEPPVKVVGDIHGQYIDYLHMLDRNGWPGKTNYIMLGDYVDRGNQSLETILLMFCFKIKYPNNFFMLRGNHEIATVNFTYGFKQECTRRYGSDKIYESFNKSFNVMPLSGLIGSRILCMHGGISRHLQDIEQLRKIPRPLEDVDDDELAVDLLWADPNVDAKGYQMGVRGTSCCFGADAVTNLCRKLNIDMVCRAHQVVQDGYEFFANRKLVTVFSAPNYCGQFNNAGAIMNIDSGMSCSFTQMQSADYQPNVKGQPQPGRH